MIPFVFARGDQPFVRSNLRPVLGPAADGMPIRIRVTIDGQHPQADHGDDIDDDGVDTVATQRRHQLVRQHSGVGDRTFAFESLDPGAQVCAFTSG